MNINLKNQILSVGIDIGTTTTHIIFSNITIQNTVCSFLVPEVKITEKKIIYESKIFFTPLITREKINLDRLKEIISNEYEIAGIDKKNITTGAVIITGETARKENAEEVLNALSNFAGDFVVAVAGSDLESILAGYGAGAFEASKNFATKVINFDIGGGTTNAAVFCEGEVIDSFALNIGGRLIQFNEEGKITYISDKIRQIINSLKLDLYIGNVPKFEDLKILTDTLAGILLQIINKNKDSNEEVDRLFIEHKNKEEEVELFMFSGGVAEFIYSDYKVKTLEDVVKFGDIGPLLGYSIKKGIERYYDKLLEPKEKIRATVIGAGSYSVRISGSTIVFNDDILPIKNIPVIKIVYGDFKNKNNIYQVIYERIKLYEGITAIAFKGPKSPTYIQIKDMAKAIVEGYKSRTEPIIIIVENDFAKALGQTIKNILKDTKKVVCIDQIKVDNGDYIDIGKSISNVIPVIIKTLIFPT